MISKTKEIITCSYCGAKQIAHAKLGKAIPCVKCGKQLFVTPSFDSVRILETYIQPQSVDESQQIVVVEVPMIPLWLLIFQAIQIGCLLAAILWMRFSFRDRQIELRIEQTRLMRIEKEQQKAIDVYKKIGYGK